MAPIIRVLVGKPGLDGHDRGAKVIARALRDAGMKVSYTGIRQTPAMIVDAAVEQEADVVALSILSGAHMELVPQVLAGLKERDMEEVMVILGGIIPAEDEAALLEMGVAGVFGPGASTEEIGAYIKEGMARPGAGAASLGTSG